MTERTAPARRGRPRSTEAESAILGAALDLVREVGYEAVAMDAIAARARVGKATLYRRWSTREDVIAEAIQRIVSRFEVPDTGTIRGDLRALVNDTARLYRDPGARGLLSSFLAAMQRSPRIAKLLRSGFIATRREAARVVVVRAIARGELREDTDVELTVDLLQAPLVYRALVTGRPIDSRMIDRVVDVVLNGIASGD